MKTKIEIYDHDTKNSGYYKVFYSENGEQKSRLIDENHVNALLNMRQKEEFFMGQYKFVISEYDFKTIVLNGEKRRGL